MPLPPPAAPAIWFTPDGPAYRDKNRRSFVLVPLNLRVPLHLIVGEPFIDSPVAGWRRRVSPDG